MVTKTYCDWCDKEIQFLFKFTLYDDLCEVNLDEVDLCKECKNLAMKLIRSRKVINTFKKSKIRGV